MLRDRRRDLELVDGRVVPELVRVADDDRAVPTEQRQRRGRLIDLRGLVEDDEVEQPGGRWEQVVDVAQRADPEGQGLEQRRPV